MINHIFLRVALPTPLRRLFDYLPPQNVDINKLIPGIRVSVPFQSRTLTGVLIEIKNVSDIPYEKIKCATQLLDERPIFAEDIYKLCFWASDYYHCSIGEVLANALPTLLRKGKSVKPKPIAQTVSEVIDIPPELNDAQKHAVDTINAVQNRFQPFLLDGITGSGKTEVYLRVIANVLNANKQVLVLVPEISLTPQTIERFKSRFNVPMITLHSNLSEQERLSAWMAARSGDIKIVIGTRSAIFTPFANLGLIIVDEEHDVSFKQQDRFRYHARDLAVMRANINQITIVLGSATPSLESLLNVKRHRYHYLSLPKRAGKAQLPHYQIIDLRHAQVEEGLSLSLLQMIRKHLDEENQVMLFLNRRGFAPVLYCTECAWVAGCKRCDARLVYHRSPPQLQCHHCDAKSDVPKYCMQCHANALQPIGLGTQRLQETLTKHFPEIPIIRVDRDSAKKKGAMEELFKQINTEKKAILLGTQMLAKGHHFPQVTLVGIVDIDYGLFSADFRAAEQMGQLLLQVAGRAGRVEKLGTVVLQTHHPEHPLLKTLIQQGYQAYSEKLLLEREEAILPPYSYFAIFRAESYKEQGVNYFLNTVKEICSSLTDSVTVLGPAPALIAKRKGLHCQHLLVRADKRSVLQHFLRNMLQKIETLSSNHSVKWILDVDPFEV